MSEPQEPESIRLRIRREAGGLMARLRHGIAAVGDQARQSDMGEWFVRRWHASRGFRIVGYLVAALLAFNLVLWATVTRNLPSADTLLTYQPPLPTMVRGINGEIVYSYARERRVQLRFVDFPKPLINAYLSAEDKTFWTHGGVDYTGLAGAVVDYATKFGSNERARGGSTITQQVAKNILIGNEYSITRKVKEMILARRIEDVLTKQQILELYLNEIPLGRQSFGVQAAARAYFGKDVGDLTLAESAFLAILPKAPEKYGRARFADEAVIRRNWVLDQMVKNGAASQAEAEQAKAQPLAIVPRRVEVYDSAAGYFVEEVRRRLIDKYGEKAEDGPNSIYGGGLWVRTSLDMDLQKGAQNALRAGLMRYQGGRPWTRPIAHIDLDDDKWQGQLAFLNKSITYKDWRVGVVLTRRGSQATIGFVDGKTAPLVGLVDAVKVGDVVAAAPTGGAWALRVIPTVSGGMAAVDPRSGRVLALQGGFDSGLDSFNRATQAERQPGSTIKPFVYATGLDFGMTPASEVVDGQFCVWQGAALGQKCFRNFDMRGAGGTHTMRWGLEQSRNLMTIRIANDTGMENVVKTIDRVGIGKYTPYLSYALGAGDTTVLQLTNAYAALANNGVQYPATTIDFVQDRNGKVIWRADTRRCAGCNMAQWDGKPMPRLAKRGKQVLDPRTAYQVVHMLEGVVTRGTATVLRDLNMPLFGKTGTTTGPTNVWFAGGSQNIVGAVYIGFDQPRSLGGYVQGGTFAAPIFKQFIQETRSRWDTRPFVAPPDVHMVKIDRVSGKRVFEGIATNEPKAGIIWEAFKADAEAKRSTGLEDIAKQRDALLAALRRGASRTTQRSSSSSAGSTSSEPDALPTSASEDVIGTQ
ncbi:penicillin-binding protein 1A [Novosphingobium kunmingense]|uniref:peptidoglycan glycosyltransferase n=1 Tax=Novosphingobium kunmingense TaxID=1211806 RepID=A0A2N0I305_9SPHN|nr:transglycosylase domain-containing protein [Novosphingobium kunmingense]PKB25576.1 penicillin-binding protein 1A [Novosphingobium kunmingense]